MMHRIAHLDESTLPTVPSAATLGGHGPGGFLSSAVVMKDSALAPGTDLGISRAAVACNVGDILLSGGPANVRDTSDNFLCIHQ